MHIAIPKLKCHPKYFAAISNGGKLFEVRVNDRNYQAGDLYQLVHFNPETSNYNGQFIIIQIDYVLTDYYALKENHCVFGFHILTRN
jgi:hypothetical protein